MGILKREKLAKALSEDGNALAWHFRHGMNSHMRVRDTERAKLHPRLLAALKELEDGTMVTSLARAGTTIYQGTDKSEEYENPLEDEEGVAKVELPTKVEEPPARHILSSATPGPDKPNV